MSKAKLKKELQKLSKEQLVEHILDTYENNKAFKEFYDFFMNSNPENEKELAEKYKKIIRKEFNVENPIRGGMKFSVAKRTIADFKNLQTSPYWLADVMITLPEYACQITNELGDMTEQFYDSTYNNFVATLKYIAKHQLLDEFKQRAQQCITWAEPCGYGFADVMYDAFYDFYE